jgi:uncharacterized protein YjbJ (UPF0337 family)
MALLQRGLTIASEIRHAVTDSIHRSECAMNTDQIKGKLKQMSGEIKRKWGQVTDDDLKQAEGSIEKLIGKIQERTGDRREAIETWLKQHDA